MVVRRAEVPSDSSARCPPPFPKPLTTGQAQAAVVVIIIMGCGDACPIYHGKRYLDWYLPDPAGLDLPTIRPTRDQIHCRVQVLADELLPPARASVTSPG